jgi:hypothetical protein
VHFGKYMLSKLQKEFLVEELNRFTRNHRIHPQGDDDSHAIEELSLFSIRRKRYILIEAGTWALVLLVHLIILLFFRKRAFDMGSSATFTVLTLGSFLLLLRAMYALGRNRKFRLIVKLLRLNQMEKQMAR